ncbi:pyridoxal-phosphate dependent enzyme [Fusobacteria bacterium ZRK30]|nr:pyridoxal-phosphate dependent enzyme [Fusobacteria bacterium ZRK30]
MKKVLSGKQIESLLEKIPKVKIGFFPTPLHKLKNISKEYGVDVYIKREDMSGPSSFGGNKVRKIEYIVGEAIEKNYDTLMTVGSYQSNAALQLAQYCNINNLNAISILGDTKTEGEPKERKGNLLLNSFLGTDIHLVHRDEPKGNYNMNPLWVKVDKKSEEVKKEYEKKGHKVMQVPVGCTSQAGWVSYITVFKEIVEQMKSFDSELDYIFHANGSAGSIPGLIVGKFLMGAKTKMISINNRRYGPGELVSEQDIFDRVKYLFNKLNIEAPADDKIWAEINIDQDYLGKGYGQPTAAGSEAIIEVAKKEGLFLDPVYTGKSFSGLLNYIRSGKIPSGSKVGYIHTGGTGGLFIGTETFHEDLKKHIYKK